MPSKRVLRKRLDELLIDRGLFEQMLVARSWIMSHKVVVDDLLVTKPGTLVGVQARIHVRGPIMKFVSRGGYKLERALERFEIDLSGKVCLDAGASAGGFTDCLLQRGAAKVYSVEVGYGVLRGKLARDARVVSREKTNIGSLTKSDFAEPLDFACGDLSYLSLRKAVPIVHALFEKAFRLVMLVKPLYEGLPQEEIANTGSLTNVLISLTEDLSEMQHAPTNACVSPILGGRGAIEFLFEFGGASGPLAPSEIVTRAIGDLERNPPIELEEFIARKGD